MKHFYNLLKSLVLITCVFMAAGAQKSWALASYDYDYYFSTLDDSSDSNEWFFTIKNSQTYSITLNFTEADKNSEGIYHVQNPDRWHSYATLNSQSKYFTSFDVTIEDDNNGSYIIDGTGVFTDESTIHFHYSQNDFANTTLNNQLNPAVLISADHTTVPGYWILKLAKSGSPTTQSVYLKVKESSDTFDNSKIYTLSDLDGSYYGAGTSSKNTSVFTNVEGVRFSGNPASGKFEIYGFAQYTNSSNRVQYCSFIGSFYTLPSTINGTESSLTWNYDNYYGYSVTFSDENDLSINLAYFKSSFDGQHNGTECNWSSLTIEGGDPIYFSSLSFTIDGDIYDGFSVEGSGTFSDGREVSFNASNKQEPEEPQEFVGDVSSLIGNSSDIKFDGVNFYDWFIEFTNSEGIKVVLDLPKATDNIFAGTYDTENGLWDGYGIYTEDQNTGDYYSYIEDASGAKVYFDHLTVVTTGDPNNDSSVWSIIGEGTLTDETPVRFYCDKNYGNPEQQVTITEAGWATYYNPSFSVTLPEGIEGYVAYIADGEFVFAPAFAANEVVPAGTAIVLKGDATDYTFSYTIGEEDPYLWNDLKGAATDITAAEMASGEYKSDYKFYALALDDETNDPESIGFYWLAANGGAFALEAGKAYLPVADNGNTLARGFSFNDALGISDIKAEKEAGVMYNVYGQRVKEAKGLVVREGKMLFVK